MNYSPNGLTNFVDHIGAIAYLVLIVCGLTGLFIRSTRGICGHALSVASWVIGLDVWLWSIAVVHSWWGIVGVIIGLLLAGIGVVPMALIASALHADWLPLGYIIVNLIIVGICNFSANSMLESARKSRLTSQSGDGEEDTAA